MKKLLSVLIAAAVAAALIPSSAFADQPTYSLTVSGESAQEVSENASEISFDILTYLQSISSDDPTQNNDELFAEYVAATFDSNSEQTQPIQQTEQKSSMQGSVQMRACSVRSVQKARETLSTYDRAIYDALLTNIKQVAAGSTNSTVFTISLKPLVDKGLLESVYYVDSLGENPGSAFFKIVTGDFHSTNTALLQDCPYELYWFDKVTGIRYSVKIAAAQNGSRTYIDTASCSLVFAYAVSADYAETHEPSTLTTTKELAKVQVAANNASALIAAHASESDLDKLESYRAAICNMVSYDKDAIYSNREYGDPWQLIYAFDNDPATNIVCEGYSKAFKHLCDNSTFSNPSVVCYTASGLMGNSPHMWNIVAINGYSYLVDITNCDEGTYGARFYVDNNGAPATSSGTGLFMRGSNATAHYAGTDSDYTDGYTVYVPAQVAGGYQYGPYTVNYYYEQDTVASLPHSASMLSTQNYNASDAPACKHGVTAKKRINVVKATCTASGSYDEVTSCVLCCKKLSTKHVTVKAHGHGYKVTNVSATSKTGSYKLHTCTYCGRSYKTDISIAKAKVTGLGAKTYTGKTLSFKPTVTVAGKKLKLGTDYTVSYRNASGKKIAASTVKSAGTYRIVFTGKGTYKGTLTKTFKIKPASASKFAVAKIATQKYTGKAVKPSPTVKFGGKKLKRGTDYTVTYKNNKKKGTAYVVIKGKGNFTGTKTVKFTISAANKS